MCSNLSNEGPSKMTPNAPGPPIRPRLAKIAAPEIAAPHPPRHGAALLHRCQPRGYFSLVVERDAGHCRVLDRGVFVRWASGRDCWVSGCAIDDRKVWPDFLSPHASRISDDHGDVRRSCRLTRSAVSAFDDFLIRFVERRGGLPRMRGLAARVVGC